MKYKFWLLLVILVLLNGCSATYDLVINEDGSAYEILKSQNYDDYYSKEDILEVAPNFFNDNSDVTYEIDELGNLTITRYKSNYKDLIDDKEINNYLGKIDINSKKISFKPDYDRCVFMFSDGGEYVTDDKIEINVTLPFKISKANADVVDGDTYTWIYSIDDCNKEAYVKFKSIGIIIYIIVGILIIGGIIYFVIKKIKNNKEY